MNRFFQEEEEIEVVGDAYRVMHKIGTGTFGNIFLGIALKTGYKYAIKIEQLDCESPQLCFEYKQYLDLGTCPGIPNVYYYGKEEEYRAMVMDLLGPSLEDLYNYCSRQFTMKTVLMIADQILKRLQYVHEKFIVHRDIKPENFLMGTGLYANLIFIVDFGLSKKFYDPKTKVHVPYHYEKSLVGTARFSSINAHNNIEQTARDDLESLGYMLMYFNRGNLPWQGLKAANRNEKYEKIAEIKMSTPPEVLCKGYPSEFVRYIHYTRSLYFEECPNYKYMFKIFHTLYSTMRYQRDFVYDWTLLKYKYIKGYKNPLLLEDVKKTDAVKVKSHGRPNVFLDDLPKKKLW